MIADYDGDISNLFNVNIEGELPILATRNMAMFPGVITPVIIGRKQSLCGEGVATTKTENCSRMDFKDT